MNDKYGFILLLLLLLLPTL